MLPLQQAGKSTFNLPLLMKFHPLLLFAGGMRWFLVFSNCHHFIQEHTTPITKLALHNHAYKQIYLAYKIYKHCNLTIQILQFLWVTTLYSSDSQNRVVLLLPILIRMTTLKWYTWAWNSIQRPSHSTILCCHHWCMYCTNYTCGVFSQEFNLRSLQFRLSKLES